MDEFILGSISTKEAWINPPSKILFLFLYKKSAVQSHPWFDLSSSDHYSLANTESDIEAQMKAGLLLPVLIIPNSELGLAIGSQHNLSSEISLDDLLNNIF